MDMDNINFQDRIDEFLLHNDAMSEEDKAQFLKEIEDDVEKREQYELTKNIKKALKSRGDKLKAMAEFQKENETQDEKRMRACSCPCPEYKEAEDVKIVGHKSNFRKKLVWFSGIAAILVIGFCAINPLFIEKNSPTDNVRGGENDVFDMTAPTDSIANDSILKDTVTLLHE